MCLQKIKDFLKNPSLLSPHCIDAASFNLYFKNLREILVRYSSLDFSPTMNSIPKMHVHPIPDSIVVENLW